MSTMFTMCTTYTICIMCALFTMCTMCTFAPKAQRSTEDRLKVDHWRSPMDPKVDPRWSTLIWSRTATDRRSCLRTSTNLVHIYILYIYKSHQCSNFNQSINVPILISGRGATFISDDIFGIARTSAFIWHPRIPLKNFCKRTRRVCVCIVLVHFGRYSQEVNEKSVKLAVWAVSLNFLHDFTLFVVDIHQIRLISLFRHFPDHFHFHGSAGLIPKVNLSLRLKLVSLNIGLAYRWALRN